MIFIEAVKTRAFSKATEVVERVETAILSIYPEEVHEKVSIRKSKTEGHAHIPIIVISAALQGKQACESTFDYIIRRLSLEDRRALEDSLNQRIDDRCVLFIRIDKQASYLQTMQLARNPDMISVQIHIRQYPRCIQADTKKMIVDRLRSVGDSTNAT